MPLDPTSPAEGALLVVSAHAGDFVRRAGSRPDTRHPRATHVWAPFRDTFLYVDLPDGTCGPPDPRELLADAVAQGGPTRDESYGPPLWRVAATDLHAVVEALWNTEGPVHIHLDQAPPSEHAMTSGPQR